MSAARASTASLPRPDLLSRPIQRSTLRLLVSACAPLVTVEDACRLRHGPSPALFVLNHSNAFEALAVPVTLIALRGGRTIHFLVDWMFLHLPLVGWIIRQSEPVPVYTKPARWRIGERYRLARRQRSPIDAALDHLRRGECVGVFPEGTRNRDPERLMRPRCGLGRLILHSDAAVVPVGIEHLGARRRGRAPVLGRMAVRVGRPLSFAEHREELRGARPGEPERRRLERTLGRAVTDEVMRHLAELCAKSYPAAFAVDPNGGQHE